MNYKRWDIVLVPFPFTDLRNEKKRPALIISPDEYNSEKDVIIAFITSNVKVKYKIGDMLIADWMKSNLPKPSLLRMKLATLDKSIIVKKIGTLQSNDINNFVKNFLEFFSFQKK